MSTQAAKGADAIKESRYEDAVKHFTDALKTQENQSPVWLIQRATAYQRLHKYTEALADADNAYLAAKARARREHMATAQFRRAVALHGLKRYGDARLCLNWTRKLNEKEKALGIWQAKIKGDYEIAEQAGIEEQIATSVKEVPDQVDDPTTKPEVKDEKNLPVSAASKDKGKGKALETPAVAAAQPTTKEKIRHEWYQSGEKISITIFAKGVPKDKAEIIIEEGSLEVSFPTSAAETYDYTISPLFARIDPSQSTYRITPHKIEITLHKSFPNRKWGSLEGTEPILSSSATEQTNPIPASVLTPAVEKGPSYPTSSRTGPKDWEKLGEEGEDDPDADDVNGFFKKLYKGADPDTQKAMMKSYMESNGTALSTNWEDVKKAPVKTQPPDGVEAKKWGE